MSNKNKEALDVIKKHGDGDGAGLAAPIDVEGFIDLMQAEDDTTLSDIRIVKNIRTSARLHSIDLGEPVIFSGEDGSCVKESDIIDGSKLAKMRVLRPIELVAYLALPWKYLWQNIEGGSVEQTLTRMFARRISLDLVFAAFTGDLSVTGSTSWDKARRIFDGFFKAFQANGGTPVYIIPGNPSYSAGVFRDMLRMLPAKYKRSVGKLRYYVSQNVYNAYVEEIGQRASAFGDKLLVEGAEMVKYNGIKVVPVYGIADGNVLLTVNDNLAIGFGREMETAQERDIKCRKTTYMVLLDADIGIVNACAGVVGTTALGYIGADIDDTCGTGYEYGNNACLCTHEDN